MPRGCRAISDVLNGFVGPTTDLCPEAHSCDKTCKLPCAGGDGESGRRLAEMGSDRGWASSLAQQTSTCPLGSFEARLQEINALCCVGQDAEDRACESGMPTTCPYRCGRVWQGATDRGFRGLT